MEQSPTVQRDGTQPTLGKNKQIAQDFLLAIASGDLNAIEKHLHKKLLWWVLGFGELNRSQFISSLGATIAGSSERSITISGITAEGNRVAVEASGAFSMPATVYQNNYHYLFIIEDDQIILGKEYLDTVEATRVFK